MTAKHRMAMVAAACVAAMGLGAVNLSAQTPAREAPAARGGGDGIAVHGHWVIEVDNPDGTMATRREFENALSDGGQALAVLLSGEASAGAWVVYLAESPSTGGPCTKANAPAVCEIYDQRLPSTTFQPVASYQASTLNVARPPGSGAVELTGQITASQPRSIGIVGTNLVTCVGINGASFSPKDCLSGILSQKPSGDPFGGSFTARILDSSIAVTVGQVIRVWVTLSFS